MKIGHLDTTGPATSVATERKGSAGPATTGTARNAGSPEASAQVALSSTAQVQGSSGEFDSEKVARIAQAIRDGKFTVNAEAIADKLIANAQELLSRNAH